MKFGLQVWQEGITYDNLKKIFRECDRLGYDSGWLYDHFYPVAIGEQEKSIEALAVLEAWTTLSALAVETKSIRVGILATCNSFRYPSLLAKMSSTLDLISNGRLEMGIGAGWFEAEQRAYGIEFPPIVERIQRLHESLIVIKKMWTEEKSTFQGKYYRITDAVCFPKPVQKPHPPLWVAGMGEKLLLRVVAQMGDYCNFYLCSPQEYQKKAAVLEAHCRTIRRDSREIGKSLQIPAFVDDGINSANRWKSVHPNQEIRDMSWDKFQEIVLIGEKKRWENHVEEYAKAGVDHLIVFFPRDTGLTPVRIFAKNIVDSFR